MNVSPKVSCICITHNRVEMFKRSKQCFHTQTWKNKELVVLFENDPATEEYITCNTHYTYAELHEEEQSTPSFFIHIPEGYTTELHTDLIITIRNAEGLTLDPFTGQWHFVVHETNEFDIVIDKFTGQSFKLKIANRWVNLGNNGKLEFTSIEEKATVYGYSRLLDTSIRLDIGPSPYPEDSLERIGWKKKIVREGTNNEVVFYNIFPRTKMTLGMKRNLSIKAAQGEYIAVWDDDDWHAENRIFNQMNFLRFTGKPAVALAYTILYDHNTDNAYHNLERATGHENTLLFKKQGAGQYGNANVEEDTPMLVSFYNRNQLSVMEDPELYIYNYHKRNTCSPAHFKMVIGRSILLGKDFAKKVKEILDAPVTVE